MSWNDTMEFLFSQEVNLNGHKFIEIFGERLEKHLWTKFEGYNHHLLKLWGVMDLHNRRKFCDYLMAERL